MAFAAPIFSKGFGFTNVLSSRVLSFLINFGSKYVCMTARAKPAVKNHQINSVSIFLLFMVPSFSFEVARINSTYL